VKPPSSGVVWITGLSGSGKTTVATLVKKGLADLGKACVHLDGDHMRSILPVTVGYAEHERRRLAMFYAQLAGEIAEQGNLVVCSTISLFRKIHTWNRENIDNYYEIWLRVPAEQLAGRSTPTIPPGVTEAEDRPMDFVGGTIVPEFPTAAHLVLDNHGEMTASRAASEILRTICTV
jgi:cytidine diphosphoramidate kinase